MLNMFTPGGFVYCFWKTAKGRLIALLILVGAVQFPLVMTPDRFSFAGDVDLSLAYWEMVRRTIVEFYEFPFWGPWHHGGVPLFANPQVTVFGIELPCLLIFGTWYGWRIAVYLYCLYGAAGMFLFLGDCTKNPMGRFWGAAVFGLAGCIPSHSMMGHSSMVCITFLPWLLYFERRLNRSPGNALLLGVTAGMMLNQSLHYLALINCLMMVLFGLPLLMRHWREGKFWLKGMLAGFTFFAVCGYRLWMTLDYLGHYSREMDERLSIPVKMLLEGLIRPFVPLNRLVVQQGELGLNWHEMGCYVGVIAVAFFLISLFPRRRWYHWGALAAALLLLDSSSKFLPGYWLRMIPPFTSFFVITRWRFLLVFFLAVGVAAGFAWCWRRLPRFRKFLLLFPVLSCVEMAANVFGIYLGNGPWLSERELLEYYAKLPRSSSVTEVIMPQIPSYVSVRHGLGQLNGYEPLLGYLYQTRFASFPYGHPEYRGEFYSLQGRARQTGWSPNRIDFQASAPDRVKINQNAGSYWRDERGEPLFPDYREFEESKPFLVDVAAGNGSIYCRPRFHEAGIALTLIALAAAVLLWYLLAKPLSGGARNGGAGRPGSL